MADLNLTIQTSIDQIAPADWDALCGSRPFVDHRWLRFIESALLDYVPRYVLLRRGASLEAAAVCSIDSRFANPRLQLRAGWMLRRFPCMRCAVPIASECGLVFRPGADVAQLAPTLVGGIRRLAFRERASFTSVGHLPIDGAVWKLLRAAGCTPLSHWRNTTLDIEWTSFDEYLAARPRDDRHELRRMRRRAERERITVEPTSVARSELPSLWRLIENVQRHHQVDNAYADDLLERALAVLGPDVHLLLARQTGDTIGCVVLVRSRDELIAKWIGLDYTRTLNTATYFMSLAACVELAINLRVRRLRLGATAYSTKEQFGVVPEDRVNALVLPAPVGRLANFARAA